MCSQTSGGSNVAIGYASLWSSTTGVGNVAIGFGSLLNSATAGFNIGVGYASMQGNTTGTCNIGIDICSHDNLDGGCNNVALGFRAGLNLSTGCYNVSIGDSVCLASATGSCQLAIGFSGTDNWLTGDSTKAIKPGAGIIDCASSTGTVGQYLWTTGANAIVWASSSPSDIRDKEVVGPVPTALPVVQQIEPITYRWKERESDVTQEEIIYGFSAQQLQEVDSVLVDNSDPDHLRIHERKIVPLLVKAIQELSAENKALRDRLDAAGI
jgi:hypothetical protein